MDFSEGEMDSLANVLSHPSAHGCSSLATAGAVVASEFDLLI